MSGQTDRQVSETEDLDRLASEESLQGEEIPAGEDRDNPDPGDGDDVVARGRE